MKTEATPGNVRLNDGLGLGAEARWYCVSREGIATLCADELDACYTAEQSDKNWQASSPHRAVRMVDFESVAAAYERCAKLCETWMESAERESGPEAAGWLHQMAQHMRGLKA